VFTTALPTKFFDYMASGLPMVVSFPGDVAEAVEREGIGIYAGDNDPAGIAAALTRLRDNPKLRDQMAKRARDLAETTFNHEHQWHKLERVLLETASQGDHVCSR
jgi:glycosyltransferase involved in cell wall biosynthesis